MTKVFGKKVNLGGGRLERILSKEVSPRKVFQGVTDAALLSLAGLSLLTSTARAANFTNYVLPTHGFNTEFVLVNNDVMNPNYAYSTLAIAYDKDGSELAREDISFATGSRVRFSLSELFPGVNPDVIGLVEIRSSNKNDAWVIYSNGDQKAMVQAPIDGSSVVYDLHFTSNTGYWRFLWNVARVNGDESVVRAVVHPSGEELLFDGTPNVYGFLMPDLCVGMGAVSLNVADVFGGTVPGDASWMEVVSEYVDHSNPVNAVVSPVDNLVGNSVFMKTNGESGGAFGNSEAFEELIIPHIADQTANPDPAKRFFWTGLVFNNPNPEAVKAVIQYYSETGVHLDVDRSTSKVDDFGFVLPPWGKKVDLVSNFGMPEGAAFARVVADKPIMGGELFGGEPSGTANWPIMAGVGLLLPGTGGYLYSVTDINTPTLRFHIPLAESKAFTDSEDGVWTGLAFVNLGRRNQTVVLEYQTESGLVVGTQIYTVKAMSKNAITVEDLLKQAGLEDIRDQVAMMDVVAKQSLAPLSDNREVNVYALQGGLAAGSGAHNWMVGEDAVNISPVDVRMFVANETTGITDSLEDIIKSMNIKVEDNDRILSHVIALLRDTKFGEITGYDIVAYDDDWNEVGSLGGFRRAAHPDMSDKVYSVNFSSDKTVDSDTCPYDTAFKLGITVHVDNNGIGQDWTYRIPDKTITRTAEKDDDVNYIYANGGGDPAYQQSENPARQITSDKIQDLATILSTEGVKYLGVRTLPYQEAYDKILGYLDGDEANGEMTNFKIFDFNEGVGNQVNFQMTQGPPETAWTLPNDATGEKLMEQLKNLYGVNNR